MSNFFINILKILMGLCLVSLLFFIKIEVDGFFKKAVPAFVRLKIWPDHQLVREKALVERLNIHMPDFSRLVQAIADDKGSDSILKTCVDYHRYVVEVMPDRFDAFLVKGVCEYRLAQYSEAETSLKKSLILRPNYFWSYYDLGMLYFNSGIREQAIKLLKEATDLNRKNTEEVFLGSRIFLHIARADERFDPVRTFNEARLNAHKAVTISCLLKNDFACARDYAEAGLKASDGEKELLLLSGVAFCQFGDYVKAVDRLNDVVERDPSNGAGHFFLAVSLKQRGDVKGFLDHLKKSQDLGFDVQKFLIGRTFPLRIY